jgi:hydrogenase maturation factor
LGRAGWSKNTLKPGDSVTVSGYAAKDGTHIIWIRKLIGPDGNSLQLFED